MASILLRNVEKIVACFIDLDNTLWEGILAEKQAIVLFQDRYLVLKTLHQRGVQLFIVSKNDLKDVDKAFELLHVDRGLFTWIIANWDPKFLNIEYLLRTTNIRVETTVFVDDHAFERVEVEQKIPGICALDAVEVGQLLTIPAIKAREQQTETEIQERKNRYRSLLSADSKKEHWVGDDKEFYRKLKRELSFGIVPSDNLDRVTRLLVETHRLNFNPGKFQDYDKALDYLYDRKNKGDVIYAIAAREGEYDLGLTGALVVQCQENVATVTDGTFSCGLIGRDFEQKTLLVLIERLQEQGILRLEIPMTLTSTNVRMREILKELGFVEKSSLVGQDENLHLLFVLDIKTYKTKDKCDWITVSNAEPVFDYVGHPFVIHFFDIYVKPLIEIGWKIANIGASRGEVLGLLQPAARKKFYDDLAFKKVQYIKVDMEYYQEEQNIVANGEDLSFVIPSDSQDLVMAVELLEHTERPWFVMQEMIRVCREGGYLFISVPTFFYPKHEYPIDRWRIGPKTLQSIFTDSMFEIIRLETEGDPAIPRRAAILVRKLKAGEKKNLELSGGEMDVERGLSVYP